MPGVAGLTAHNLDLIRELPKDVQLTARRLYFHFESLHSASLVCLVVWMGFVVGITALFVYFFARPAVTIFDWLRLLIVISVTTGIGRTMAREVHRRITNRHLEKIAELANENLESQLTLALLIEKVPLVCDQVQFYQINYLPRARRPTTLEGKNP